MSVPGTNPNITGAYYVQYASPYSKAVAFSYINDPSLVLYTQQGVAYATGGFRPMSTNDLGDITITGLSIAIGAVAVTGSPNVTINGGLVGITGSPFVTLAGVPNVTISGGYVGITGVHNVGITGQPAVTAYQPITVGGPGNFVSSGSAGVQITGVAIAANAARLQAYVQNVGSGSALFVKLGAAPASDKSFSFILKAASADLGADGGSWTDNGFYTGVISVSGSTRYIAWDA